jgi:hypothetical protein
MQHDGGDHPSHDLFADAENAILVFGLLLVLLLDALLLSFTLPAFQPFALLSVQPCDVQVEQLLPVFVEVPFGEYSWQVTDDPLSTIQQEVLLNSLQLQVRLIVVPTAELRNRV